MYDGLTEPSEVYPGLWLAGARWPYPRDMHVDLLVTLCEEREIRYTPSAGEEICLPMRDASTEGATRQEILDLVDEIVDALQQGESIMVRCQWGVERSGMVAALALRVLTGQSFPEVLAALRVARSRHVLFNPNSTAWEVASGDMSFLDELEA